MDKHGLYSTTAAYDISCSQFVSVCISRRKGRERELVANATAWREGMCGGRGGEREAPSTPPVGETLVDVEKGPLFVNVV